MFYTYDNGVINSFGFIIIDKSVYSQSFVICGKLNF